MISQQATIRNKYGIHCRPAAVIVKEAQAYSGSIRVSRDGSPAADVHTILALLGLGICCGERVTASVDGPDETACCQRFVELFETDFDFPRNA